MPRVCLPPEVGGKCRGYVIYSMLFVENCNINCFRHCIVCSLWFRRIKKNSQVQVGLMHKGQGPTIMYKNSKKACGMRVPLKIYFN